MPKVTLDFARHIIDFGEHDQRHLLQQFAGATIETHDTLPNGIRRGNYLHTDNTVQRPRDGHRSRHEEEHWNEAVEWAKHEQENILRARILDLNDQTKTVAKLFGGIIYSVLLAASNVENRLDIARWNWLKGSMVSWKEFSLRVDYYDAFPFIPLSQSGNIQSAIAPFNNDGLRDFLDEDNIYVYNPETHTVQKIRGSGVDPVSDTAPRSADDANHFLVKDILNYRQDADVTLSGVRHLQLSDRNGIPVTALSPTFSSDVLEYTATTSREDIYINVIAFKHLRVEVEGVSFTIHTRGQERRGRLGLSVGENVVEIRTQSQEGSDSKTYTVTISRI